MDKLNFFHIVINHLKTLRNIRTGKTSWLDIFVFLILPFIISVIIVYFNITLNSIIGDVLKAIAIFSAFLFNMLAIVNSSLNDDRVKNDEIKKIYAKEIHSNLSFEILIGIILVFFLIVQSILIEFTNDNAVIWARRVISIINFSLLGTFLLTLVMCLNRVYILLRY